LLFKLRFSIVSDGKIEWQHQYLSPSLSPNTAEGA
jgi:hypothetical protein